MPSFSSPDLELDDKDDCNIPLSFTQWPSKPFFVIIGTLGIILGNRPSDGLYVAITRWFYFNQ